MKKITFKKTSAFTMLELVFIIVVVGILAAVILPRMQTSRLREAADQVAAHIRYTQHLAMQDDKYDTTNAGWFQERWQINFADPGGNQWTYTIFSDQNADNAPDAGEIAQDPQDTSGFLQLNIGKKYGIINVAFGDGCAGNSNIVFDYIGRPMIGAFAAPYPANSLIAAQCTITLTDKANDFIKITIEQETGFVDIGAINAP